MYHFTLVMFWFGIFSNVFELSYNGNVKSAFCFIKNLMQIAKIHLQCVRSHILNHNKSLLFSSSFSYCVREKKEIAFGYTLELCDAIRSCC